MKVWLSGVLIEAADAKVSVFDHGLTVGDAVFETIAVRGGEPLALTRHLRRLERSADVLSIPAPDVERITDAVCSVISANLLAEATIRVLHTSGGGPLGSSRGEEPPTTAVLAGPLTEWPAVADVVCVDWPRNERSGLAGVKSTSYAENVLALAEARRRGASEAVFPNLAGNLCGGTGSNVFLVLNGQLVTPPLSAGCLDGVSRGLIIERSGVKTDEVDVPVSALETAEEAFLTSATRDVQSIRSVNGRRLPAAPGPVTQQVRNAYRAFLARHPDPA